MFAQHDDVPPGRHIEVQRRLNFSRQSFAVVFVKDGLAASKNWKTRSSVVHRSGTSIYRKKIDTQKVYLVYQI